MTVLVEITALNDSNYLEQILEIEKASFPSPWNLNAFRQEIRNPNSQIWGLAVNEVLCGYICFWVFKGEIQLVNLAVHPQQRGKGLAHRLLTRMIEVGISRGTHYIWLEVRPSNSAARSLYQKLGFAEIGRRRRYYSDTNEDAIVMALRLSGNQGLGCDTSLRAIT